MSWIPIRPQVNLPLLKSLLKGNSPSCICTSKGLLHAIKFAGHFSLTAKLEMTVQRRCIDLILQKNGKMQKNVKVSSDYFCIYLCQCAKGEGEKVEMEGMCSTSQEAPLWLQGCFFPIHAAVPADAHSLTSLFSGYHRGDAGELLWRVGRVGA